MPPRLSIDFPVISFLSLGLALATCGGDPTEPETSGPGELPDPTALEITVNTAGEDRDLSGYMITMGEQFWQIGRDTVLTVEMDAGSHVLELEDLADNCSVAEGSTREAVLAEGETATIEWSVSCTGLPDATVDVTGTWYGHLSDCECHTIRYVLEQVGDDVPTAQITYANTLQGIVNEFSGVGRVSGNTLTIFYEGRRQLPTVGPFVRVTATLEVNGGEMQGKETEQRNLWVAELILTRE